MRAEHFIAHGECLLSAVRAVFNLALGAENPVNKRTASNALLQMLNTICKRVTQIQPRLTGGSSECSSRTVSEALELYYSVAGAGFHNHSSPHCAKGSGTHLDHMAITSPQAPMTGQGSLQGHLPEAASGVVYDPDAPSSGVAAAADGDAAAGAGEGSEARISSSSAAAHARAAQLAELAEKKDLQGLEAALEAAAAAAEDADDSDEDESAELRTSATAAVVSAGLQSLSAAAGGSTGGAPPDAAHAPSGANGMLATQGSSAGGAQAGAAGPQQLQGVSSGGPVGGALQAQSSWHQQQYYHSRMPGTPSYAGRAGRHGQRLTTQEKDVLLVLTAFCKLASREVPGGTASSDSVLAQGKLLALEMLAKVRPVTCDQQLCWQLMVPIAPCFQQPLAYIHWLHLSETSLRRIPQASHRRLGLLRCVRQVLSNPMHNWEHVPESFCRQLRQPLCMALLRNCATPDSAAYGLALKLLMAILNLPRYPER